MGIISLCGAAYASQLVISMDAAVEAGAFPPKNPLTHEKPAAGVDVKAVVKAALRAADAARTAAEEAQEVANTPAQRAEATRLMVQAATHAKDAQAKEYLLTPGSAPQKSFAQLESDQANKQQDAKKLAQVQEFTSEVQRDETAIKVRNEKIEKDKAVYLKNLNAPAPGHSAEAKEKLQKAVAIERHHGDQALKLAKQTFAHEMEAQRVNLTHAMKAAVMKAQEVGEKNVAGVQAKAHFDRKKSQMKREYDAMVAEKQLTANAMLKAQMATHEESAHIKAAASAKAAAIVAKEAEELHAKYPSEVTQDSAQAAEVKELNIATRSTKLRNLAHRALADANDAQQDADAARKKQDELDKLDMQTADANSTAIYAATELAKASGDAVVRRHRLLRHEDEMTKTALDFEKSKKDLATAGIKENSSKAKLKDAKTRQEEAMKAENNAPRLPGKLDAAELQFKASGAVKVMQLKDRHNQEEHDRIQADANYKEIELGKLRLQGKAIYKEKLASEERKKEAFEQHAKAVQNAQAAALRQEKTQRQLVLLQKKKHGRESKMKKELMQAKIEAQQDVHETTAKAAQRAQKFADFKLQETRIKLKRHAELKQKADRAQEVLQNVISVNKSPKVENNFVNGPHPRQHK